MVPCISEINGRSPGSGGVFLARFTIGVDFGTESGRVTLVNIETGEEVATHETIYKNGMIARELPNGKSLEADWALQDPQDYLNVLYQSIPKVISISKVLPKDIIGIGVDFTSSTILPLDHKGDPLCFNQKWKNHPHSWVKLWKHHAAQEEAEYMTHIAETRGEIFLNRYGGKISSEWMFPKILQILREDFEIYSATDVFIEACDWITFKLTAKMIRSSNTTGYKAFWNKRDGYPTKEFFKEVDPRLENITDTKMRGLVRSIGQEVGTLTNEMAMKLGLVSGTSVAVGIIDAHASVPSVSAVKPGQMVLAMGTSTCHMMLAEEEKFVKGVCGIVEDGIVPGYYSYETGQVAVGDSFGWFIDNAVSYEYKMESLRREISVHKLLEEKASLNKPGQSGLIALDWWNGNRSVLVDANLSGIIIGLTLSTKPEDIYRALLESTAYGTRKIIESFIENGIEVNEIFACGGLPRKNRLLMQIYADVTNREIKISGAQQSTALGASIYAAVAAGEKNGGYDSISEAVKKMSRVEVETFKPIPENVAIYNELYKNYLSLHDYFGIDNNTIMHKLKKRRNDLQREITKL